MDSNKGKTEHKKRCFLCGKNHAICYCIHFRRMLCDERRKALKGQSICFNCLGYGHHRTDCLSVNRCTVCGYKHHSMLHHGFSSIGSSSVEDLNVVPVPMAAKFKTRQPKIEADFKRLTLGENTVPATFPRALMFPELIVAPVIECVLRAGNREKKLTLMLLENVPKSQLLFEDMESLNYPTKFKNDTAYGQFNMGTPDGGHITEWFIMVDKFNARIEPPVRTYELKNCLRRVGPLAHPDPEIYSKINGIIGRDIARRICTGVWTPTKSHPNIRTKQTIFGIVGSGIWENEPFSIEMLKK